ncbi:MAG: D-glycero-beta-D-manno-heptose 1-phosphate adenylyltransferase [Acidobacteria bacterium]|nr:MAG: D-glycero-beta-D-manno-heptose 1-phosphate adenylyltransferase [Acidobacteriota bacterium]
MEKVLPLEDLLERVGELRQRRKKIVFTNGCFDILHPGHVSYLQKARQLGDTLIVGINSDRSVRELKGELRPILTQEERCQLLSGLESVNFITIFNESTPRELIRTLLPDVLVKGGDWGVEEIVGREAVETAGGRVVSLPFEIGHSSSGIIERILRRYKTNP